MIRIGAAIHFLLACVLATTVQAQQSEPIAISARRLIDGAGRMIDNATVVVQGNRITSVGALPASFRGRRIDLGDATLMPGLIDVHAHVVWYFNAEGRYHTSSDGETPAQAAIAAAGNAYETLMSGWPLLRPCRAGP
jgi:imidazolonepropionase-like amidohydrolase